MPPSEFSQCDPLAAYRQANFPKPRIHPSGLAQTQMEWPERATVLASHLRWIKVAGLLLEPIADFPQFWILERARNRKLLKNSKLMLSLALALSVHRSAYPSP